MALDLSMLEAMGLEEILLWLLSFAVVFGVLSQVKMPESKGTRGIIAIVIAFFALFAAAGTGLIDVLSGMSVGLLMIILAIIVFIVFLETAGVKVGAVKTDKGLKYKAGEGENVMKQHPLAFGVALIVIAGVIFIGAGGLELLGYAGAPNFGEVNYMTLFFFGVIVLAIIWLIANPD